jgi:hypothetical protein
MSKHFFSYGEMVVLKKSIKDLAIILPTFPTTYGQYIKLSANNGVILVDNDQLMTVIGEQRHTAEEVQKIAEEFAMEQTPNAPFHDWVYLLLSDGRMGWLMNHQLEAVTNQ